MLFYHVDETELDLLEERRAVVRWLSEARTAPARTVGMALSELAGMEAERKARAARFRDINRELIALNDIPY